MNISALLKMRFLIALPIAIAFIIAIGNVDAAPYQELEPRKGYVPVYIRYDNTPLSEIHPKLAEAFDEDETNGKSEIESASLIEMRDETDTNQSSQTKQIPTSTSKDTNSDIASFDVIKGTDHEIKE